MAPRKRSIALIYGFIAGLILVGFTFVSYRMGLSVYLGKVGFIGYIVLFGMMAAAALMEKKAKGGFLEFREALRACFAVLVIALAMQTLFTWILMNYIDIPFRQAAEQKMLEIRTEMMRDMLHTPQDDIDKYIAENKGVNQHTLPKLLQSLVVSYIGFFLVAALIAAIVKKKKATFKEAGRQHHGA